MLSVLLILLGLSLLILGHEAGHFFVAKLFKLKVEEFGFGFPPRLLVKQRGETKYSLNWLPFGGFVKIAGEEQRLLGDGEDFASYSPEEKRRLFLFQPAWRRMLVILAGVAVNFTLGWLLLSGLLMVGRPPALLVSGLEADSPVEVSGLRQGDVIVGFGAAEAFIAFVDEHRGQSIAVKVKRGDQELSVTVTPRRDPLPGHGALGVYLTEAGIARRGFTNALLQGLEQSGAIFWATLLTFGQLVKDFFTRGELIEGVVGPVGIFSIAAQTSGLGFLYLIQLLAVISINLAALNLIPFPALDGGRFVLILIEKLKGSPLSRRTEVLVNGLGFAFLILLMVLVTIRDVAQHL